MVYGRKEEVCFSHFKLIFFLPHLRTSKLILQLILNCTKQIKYLMFNVGILILYQIYNRIIMVYVSFYTTLGLFG